MLSPNTGINILDNVRKERAFHYLHSNRDVELYYCTPCMLSWHGQRQVYLLLGSVHFCKTLTLYLFFLQIRDLCLGTQFPIIKSVSIKDAVLHPQYQHIETLELCLDIEYSGGFQLSIDANMVLGKAAYLSVKGLFMFCTRKFYGHLMCLIICISRCWHCVVNGRGMSSQKLLN